MKPFWSVIAAILAVSLFGLIAIASEQTSRAWRPSRLQSYLTIAFMGIMVGVIWAIFFRREVESRKFTVRSLFALIAMEAVLLLAIRTMNPELIPR